VTVAFVADATGVRFAVKVVPGAARDRIQGALGEALKVQVAAPPEQGKANTRLCELLAAALGVPTRSVVVASGHGSARKVVHVRGLDADTARERLLPAD
jgi:uncharacterized protein (TIGR00251 family)